jgi:hypothetical protein
VTGGVVKNRPGRLSQLSASRNAPPDTVPLTQQWDFATTEMGHFPPTFVHTALHSVPTVILLLTCTKYNESY